MAVDVSALTGQMYNLGQARAMKKQREEQRRQQRRALIGGTLGALAGGALTMSPQGAAAGYGVGSGLATGNTGQVIQSGIYGAGAYQGQQAAEAQQAQQAQDRALIEQNVIPALMGAPAQPAQAATPVDTSVLQTQGAEGQMATPAVPAQAAVAPDRARAAAMLMGLSGGRGLAPAVALMGQAQSAREAEQAQAFREQQLAQQRELAAQAEAGKTARTQAQIRAQQEAVASKAPSPSTKLGKANQDLKNGLITEEQYYDQISPTLNEQVSRITNKVLENPNYKITPQEKWVLDTDANRSAREIRRRERAGVDAPPGGVAAPAAEARPLPSGMSADSMREAAKQAIASGKDPAAVKRRLAEYGVSTEGL